MKNGRESVAGSRIDTTCGMRFALAAAIAIGALLPTTGSRLPAQSIDDARDSIRAGRYEAAIAMLTRPLSLE